MHAYWQSTINVLNHPWGQRAWILCVQGKYEEADIFFLDAIEISTATLGPDHPSLATTLNNRACLLKDQVSITLFLDRVFSYAVWSTVNTNFGRFNVDASIESCDSAQDINQIFSSFFFLVPSFLA